MTSYSDINKIPLFKYGLIMADPAWKFALRSPKGEKKSPQAKYSCMDLEEIKALNVRDIAAPDCWLWLWATNPMLREAFEVLDAWGFRFSTAGHWTKTHESGKLCMGGGYALRSSGEPYLLAKMGEPKGCSKSVRGSFLGLRRAHSQKPEEGYMNAEELAGDVPKLELFSRMERDGWDTFGDETDTLPAN